MNGYESQDNDLPDFMRDDTQVVPYEGNEKSDLSEDYHRICQVTDLAEALIVNDEQSCKRAIDISADAKTIFNSIEDRRKKLTEPHRKIVQNMNEAANKLKSILANVEGILVVKIATWSKMKEVEALKHKEYIDMLSESLNLSVGIVAPSAPSTITTDKAKTYTREKKKFEIVDEQLIPDEYWVLDEKALQKQIDMGRSDIPGIKIIKEKKMFIRRKQ